METEVYFPGRLLPVDLAILKGQSAWKYVLSVEAPKESQPL